MCFLWTILSGANQSEADQSEAKKWLTRAIELKNPRVLIILADSISNNDLEKSLFYYEMAANYKNPKTTLQLESSAYGAFKSGMLLLTQKKYLQAKKYFLIALTNDSRRYRAYASGYLCQIASALNEHDGAEKRNLAAIKLLSTSDDLTFRNELLAFCYRQLVQVYDGLGSTKDKALYYLTKGEELGDSWCYTVLGFKYANGDGVSKSIPKSIEYFKKGIHDFPESAFFIGLLCAQEGPQFYSEAYSWLKRAADHNPSHAETQALLGFAYYKGLGVEKNFALALELLQKGHDGGSKLATTHLAILYLQGIAVAQDLTKAVTLLKLAASSGSNNAMQLLKIIFDAHINSIYAELSDLNNGAHKNWIDRIKAIQEKINELRLLDPVIHFDDLTAQISHFEQEIEKIKEELAVNNQTDVSDSKKTGTETNNTLNTEIENIIGKSEREIGEKNERKALLESIQQRITRLDDIVKLSREIKNPTTKDAAKVFYANLHVIIRILHLVAYDDHNVESFQKQAWAARCYGYHHHELPTLLDNRESTPAEKIKNVTDASLQFCIYLREYIFNDAKCDSEKMPQLVKKLLTQSRCDNNSEVVAFETQFSKDLAREPDDLLSNEAKALSYARLGGALESHDPEQRFLRKTANQIRHFVDRIDWKQLNDDILMDIVKKSLVLNDSTSLPSTRKPMVDDSKEYKALSEAAGSGITFSGKRSAKSQQTQPRLRTAGSTLN